MTHRFNCGSGLKKSEWMDSHFCNCNKCLDVIVGVVQRVLAEDMDLDEDSGVDTEETVEYSDDEEESLAASQDSTKK